MKAVPLFRAALLPSILTYSAVFLDCVSAGELAAFTKAKNSVTVEELHAHAAALADDTFEGREAGSRGGRAAAGYILDRVQAYALDPAGVDDGYTQSFLRSHRNLLAVLPGNDPQLADEIILVGAHYDHVGYGSPSNSYGPLGYIHNGADDNASGVAALLETAQALSGLRGSLRRTILFAFWDGEEKGLLGSTHWLAHPTLDKTRVKCAVNLDMVGRLRNEKLEVYGTRTAPGMRRRVSLHNRQEDLVLDFPWTMIEDSDHYPFYKAGYPSLMLHTGKHGDYHRPSDDIEKINFEGIQSVTRLLIDLLIDLAETDDTLAFREQSRKECRDEREREAFERPTPPTPGRLGLTWKADRTGEHGIVVSDVSRNTPAYRAGIVSGDRITTWNGEPLRTNEQFQRLVSTAIEPATLTIVPRTGREPRQATVTLDGGPVRIGITWSEDDGDPGSMFVRRVNPSSPADRGGVQASDRIYAVDGKSFNSAAEFEQLLLSASGTVQLTIERKGKVETVALEVGDPLPSVQ